MKLIIIIILAAMAFCFADMLLKYLIYAILFFTIFHCIYKFINWLIYKIKYIKLENDLDRINASLYDIEEDLNNLIYESQSYSYNNYDNMNGYEFEQFCADLLEQNGFIDINVTQYSGDHGIDILAVKDDISYAIQCKCYSSNIGNASVQQAHTGKSIYRKDIAVVMTNRYFTQQAIEEAKALGVKLWDRDKLNEMIENAI